MDLNIDLYCQSCANVWAHCDCIWNIDDGEVVYVHDNEKQNDDDDMDEQSISSFFNPWGEEMGTLQGERSPLLKKPKYDYNIKPNTSNNDSINNNVNDATPVSPTPWPDATIANGVEPDGFDRPFDKTEIPKLSDFHKIPLNYILNPKADKLMEMGFPAYTGITLDANGNPTKLYQFWYDKAYTPWFDSLTYPEQSFNWECIALHIYPDTSTVEVYERTDNVTGNRTFVWDSPVDNKTYVTEMWPSTHMVNNPDMYKSHVNDFKLESYKYGEGRRTFRYEVSPYVFDDVNVSETVAVSTYTPGVVDPPPLVHPMFGAPGVVGDGSPSNMFTGEFIPTDNISKYMITGTARSTDGGGGQTRYRIEPTTYGNLGDPNTGLHLGISNGAKMIGFLCQLQDEPELPSYAVFNINLSSGGTGSFNAASIKIFGTSIEPELYTGTGLNLSLLTRIVRGPNGYDNLPSSFRVVIKPEYFKYLDVSNAACVAPYIMFYLSVSKFNVPHVTGSILLKSFNTRYLEFGPTTNNGTWLSISVANKPYSYIQGANIRTLPAINDLTSVPLYNVSTKVGVYYSGTTPVNVSAVFTDGTTTTTTYQQPLVSLPGFTWIPVGFKETVSVPPQQGVYTKKTLQQFNSNNSYIFRLNCLDFRNYK